MRAGVRVEKLQNLLGGFAFRSSIVRPEGMKSPSAVPLGVDTKEVLKRTFDQRIALQVEEEVASR